MISLSKRGLSPVIATVLLIFLVLILAVIVFLWARGFFFEKIEKAGEAIENQCRMVDFRATVSEYRGGTTIALEISNNGDIDLFAVSLKEKRAGFDYTDTHVINLASGSGTEIEANLKKGGIDDLDEIIIYPVLLGNVVGKNENKEFTCIENPQRIRV